MEKFDIDISKIYSAVGRESGRGFEIGPDDYRFYGLSKPSTDEEVKRFIEKNLFIYKEGKVKKIIVSRKMLELICDFFFERTRHGILWKNRGGSGSLSAAIIIFLKTLFQSSGITNMAGCLLPDMHVCTDEGTKEIKDIKEGDKCYNKLGEIDEVMLTHKFYWEGDIYDIYLDGFDKPFSFTPHHEIYVSTLNRIETLDAERLDRNSLLIIPDVLKEKYGISCLKIREIKKRYYAGDVYDLSMLNDPSYCVPFAVSNSGDQAANVYRYVKDFYLKCIPGLSEILVKKPTKRLLELKNGGKVEIISASEQQARGIHNRILILDEACQKNPQIAPIMRSAMNTVYSEDNNMILLLSTFHVEEQFFSEHWDNAERKKFKRYHWTIYDSMRTCDKPYDCKKCPLTRQEPIMNRKGEIIGYKTLGCNGIARMSDGYMTFDQVLDVYIKHDGDMLGYMIEHESTRPTEGMGLVYSTHDIYSCQERNYEVLKDDDEYHVLLGIDWGWSGSAMTAIVAAEYPVILPNDEFKWKRVGVNYLFYENRKSISHILGVLSSILNKYGISKERLIIRADSSHPFNNQEIINAGFNLKVIPFKSYKEIGIKNVSMFLRHKMILFDSDYKSRKGVWEIIKYMAKYVKLENGSYNKDDHIPDAILCLLTKFNFLALYDDYLEYYKEEILNESG